MDIVTFRTRRITAGNDDTDLQAMGLGRQEVGLGCKQYRTLKDKQKTKISRSTPDATSSRKSTLTWLNRPARLGASSWRAHAVLGTAVTLCE